MHCRWMVAWVCVLSAWACGSATDSAVATSAAADAPPARRVVAVDGGEIAGVPPSPGDQVRVYKGIPYAAPPLGDRRWRPPQSVEPWTGVREATRVAPACMQTKRPVTINHRHGLDFMDRYDAVRREAR